MSAIEGNPDIYRTCAEGPRLVHPGHCRPHRGRASRLRQQGSNVVPVTIAAPRIDVPPSSIHVAASDAPQSDVGKK
jgi:hypothetical protein